MVVAQHGGFIRVKSVEGESTTFDIFIQRSVGRGEIPPHEVLAAQSKPMGRALLHLVRSISETDVAITDALTEMLTRDLWARLSTEALEAAGFEHIVASLRRAVGESRYLSDATARLFAETLEIPRRMTRTALKTAIRTPLRQFRRSP